MDRLDLHAYVDGEATRDERRQYESDLADDPQARAEVANIHALKALVARGVTSSEELAAWRSCCRRLDELDRTKRIEGFVGRYSWALCAVFMFVILVGGVIKRGNPSVVRTGEAAGYVSSMVGGFSRAPQDAANRQAWMNEKLGVVQSLVQPDRLEVLDAAEKVDENGRRVACFRLADSRGLLALLVVTNANEVEGVRPMDDSLCAGSMGDANCVVWSQSNISFFLIGPRDHDELARIAQTIRKQ